MTLRTIVDCDHKGGCNRAEIIGPFINVRNKIEANGWVINDNYPKNAIKHYCPDHIPEVKG